MVEGHRVGRLEGLDFVPEATDAADAKAVLTVARRVLPAAIARRVGRIGAAEDAAIGPDARGRSIGRESCRARACRYVKISAVAVLFKKTHISEYVHKLRQ